MKNALRWNEAIHCKRTFLIKNTVEKIVSDEHKKREAMKVYGAQSSLCRLSMPQLAMMTNAARTLTLGSLERKE